MQPKHRELVVELTAESVGGIDDTEVHFDPGVTILEGRNATNRTSLLQGCMAALGSDEVTLKGDADEGFVELAIGTETYTRTLERKNGTVVTGGRPYLDDSELANLFAYLLESNEARQAVARGGNLRELILKPIDTEAIQSEIQQLEAEKRRLDDELEELESLKRDLPRLEQKRNRFESNIEDERAELEQKEAELKAVEADVDETRQEKAELESKLEELRNTRSQLERVRFDAETEEESVESLRNERRELRTEREEAPEASTGETRDIDAEIGQLRGQKGALNSETTELQAAIQFNEELLEESGEHVLASWHDDAESSEQITDKLLEENEVVTCWTCGSDVQKEQITTTLDRLRELRREKLDETRSVQERLDDLAEEKRELEQRQQRRERIDQKLDRINTEIDDRTGNLEELRNRRGALTDEVSELETEIEALEEQEYSEILELHREANQLEFELETLESDLETVTDEIATIEKRLEEQEQIEDERDAIRAELETLRNRIERIEQQAVEEFNEHMEAVLDVLDYANLERIWIERTEQTVRDGRRTVSKGVYDVHVVRKSDNGATYEDTVSHLSESEREVTGLVFALAGYLVHEVYETVPFMLLDSLEAVDSNRIATLVEYFSEYADYLVVALLTEDAKALDDSYRRVTDI